MELKLFWKVMLIASLLVIPSQGQTHKLKYIDSGITLIPSSPPQFTSDSPRTDLSNVKNRFSNANRICVDGLWALYNNTDFGEGRDDTTTVISIKGTDLQTCTSAGQIPTLRDIKSVLYLGNRDFSQNGMIIFSQAYFLGGSWDVARDGTVVDLPDTITGFPLGSIAITGSSAWLICADQNCNTAVCVDMKFFGNRFIQRNTVRDKSLANGWPKIVRKVQIVAPDTCLNYPNLNPKRLSKREASKKMDISVDTL